MANKITKELLVNEYTSLFKGDAGFLELYTQGKIEPGNDSFKPSVLKFAAEWKNKDITADNVHQVHNFFQSVNYFDPGLIDKFAKASFEDPEGYVRYVRNNFGNIENALDLPTGTPLAPVVQQPTTGAPATGTTNTPAASGFAEGMGEWGTMLKDTFGGMFDAKNIKEHPILSTAVVAGIVGLISSLADIWSSKGMMAKGGAMMCFVAIAGILSVVTGLFGKDKGIEHAFDQNSPAPIVQDARRVGERQDSLDGAFRYP